MFSSPTLQLGPHELPGRLFVAPMAGVTDRPFRMLCKRLGAAYAVILFLLSIIPIVFYLRTVFRDDVA